MDENERLSWLGLFPVPDGIPFDQADIQQIIVYRAPLISVIEAVNLLQFGERPVLDVKYFDGNSLVDVVLQVNGVIVWSKES